MKLDRTDPNAWPYQAVTEHAKQRQTIWREISQERADEFLEVLPPIYVRGGFMVSEAADSDERGMPTYACVAKAGGSYWMREMAQDRAAQAIVDLREHLEYEASLSAQVGGGA